MPKAYIFALVSAAVTAVMATTGCAYLLFGPSHLYVTSLPPRDNPLASALSTPTDRGQVEPILNAFIAGQPVVPANTSCADAAVAGCRYRILLQQDQIGQVIRLSSGCVLLDAHVEAGFRGGARIGMLKFSPTTCSAAIPPLRPPE
jgi:hypothetical protein